MTLLFRWTIPVIYFLTALGVAVMLLVVLGRSPNTRLNFVEEPGTYDRTEIAVLGSSTQFQGVSTLLTGNAREQYIQAGCANCHGLNGQGGSVGPDIREKTDEDFDFALREGVPGMPLFGHERLSPQQAQAILNFVNEQAPAAVDVEQPEQASVPDANEQ